MGGGDVGASRLGVLVGGLVGAFIVTRVMGRASVVRTRRMAKVILSADKVAKVASMHQFFDFIPECFTVLCSMAMVAVIATIFGHVGVGGSGRLAWRWDEVSL